MAMHGAHALFLTGNQLHIIIVHGTSHTKGSADVNLGSFLCGRLNLLLEFGFLCGMTFLLIRHKEIKVICLDCSSFLCRRVSRIRRGQRMAGGMLLPNSSRQTSRRAAADRTLGLRSCLLCRCRIRWLRRLVCSALLALWGCCGSLCSGTASRALGLACGRSRGALRPCCGCA